jgi:hypothetical protein
MMVHGDLQVQAPELLLAQFGNLPAWCLQFIMDWISKFTTQRPVGEIYFPSDVITPILIPSVGKARPDLIKLAKQTWREVTGNKLYEFQRQWASTTRRAEYFYNIALDEDRWLAKYGRFVKEDVRMVTYWDFLIIYREAERVDQLFQKRQMPFLYLERQRRCIPLTSKIHALANEMYAAKIARKIKKRELPSEPFVVVQDKAQ